MVTKVEATTSKVNIILPRASQFCEVKDDVDKFNFTKKVFFQIGFRLEDFVDHQKGGA